MSDEEPVRYTLDAIFNDVPIVVLWNDWPIVQRQTSGTQSNLLNPFVVEGDNVLRVLAGPVTELGSQFIGVGLFKWDPGSDERQTIFQVEWTPRFGYTKDGYHEVARHVVHARKAFGRWRWEDAKPFRIEDEPTLKVEVLKLRDALKAKDIDGMMSRSRLKMAEMGRATGRHGGAVEGVQREMLRTMFDGGAHVFPWNEDDLRFRSGAQGRLVRVFLEDGSEPLSFMAGDNMVEVPLVYSHLDSGFELVR